MGQCFIFLQISHHPPFNQHLSAFLLLHAQGDNNYGDGIALNGVPLAKADPLSFLSSINNPAPLDWCAPNGS